MLRWESAEDSDSAARGHAQGRSRGRRGASLINMPWREVLTVKSFIFVGSQFSWIHENGYIRGDVISWVG